MNGLETYKLFQAIRLHFKSKDYDVIKMRGRVRGCTQEIFDNRNDKYLFEKIGKKFQKTSDIVQFFVANFAYGNDQVIYSPESFDYYFEWRRRKESITYIFQNDITKISDVVNPFTMNNSEPPLLKLLLGKKVNLETVCILDRELNFIETHGWDDMTLVWGDLIMTINKTKAFVQYDKAKIDVILRDEGFR